MTKLNRSIERGLSVLDIVHVSGPCSLAFLAGQTGLPKPTVLRICATLEHRRWLMRMPGDGRYQLGPAFPRVGGQPDLAGLLVAAAGNHMTRLSRASGLGVDLACGIGGGRIEVVATTRDYEKHGIHPDVAGFRPSPVLSALGIAYLAALPQRMLKDLDRLPGYDDPRLPQLLASVRARGYAVRMRGYWGRAVDYGALPSAIAVAVLAGDAPVGALNLVWNGADHPVEHVVNNHLDHLHIAAKAIGQHYLDQGEPGRGP